MTFAGRSATVTAMPMYAHRLWQLGLVLATGGSLGACASGESSTTETTAATTSTTGQETEGPKPVTTTETSGATDDSESSQTGTSETSNTTDEPTSESDSDSDTGGPDPLCPVTFKFRPNGPQTNPRVAGVWQGFDLATALALDEGPDADGFYTGTTELAPGLHAYKIVVDQGGEPQWLFDPEQARRTYVDQTENSAVLVRDCQKPAAEVVASTPSRPAPGQGMLSATLRYHDGLAGEGPDIDAYTLELDQEGVVTPIAESEYTIDPDSGDITLNLAGLDDGKYTVRVRVGSADGQISEPVRVVFWIEAEAFSWRDALVYMVLTDRFRDGDPGNNPGDTPMSDPRGDFQGGDLEGVRQAIADGTLDKLGVRAIWLTPFQQNPDGAYIASDGQHYVTGYHGYWPTQAREVDTRLGGSEALHDLVAEAHAHGIRILQDFVINHVHEDHEYMQMHPDWFRTGCVCGTQDCGWTSHALECMFASYLPDINHTVPEATAAFVDDAIWWLDTYNLDGLRVDAVKHVEEVATRNLSAAVAETFEVAGTQYFLMGETAMGWSDCADPCNDENYGTISRYIGPHGLDGQFDFVLYHATAYNTFAYGDKGMLHAAYWLEHGLQKWPEDAIMTPYVGSHDTPRFATLADYRGQDPGHDRGVAHNQWTNTAEAPGDDEPYWRTRVAFAWLLGLPGAPLLYYGDEYGQWGGADPNNRLMWRPDGELSSDEQQTLAFIRLLGKARQQLPPLRRGSYVPLAATEDALVYGRMIEPGDAVIVGINRAPQPAQLEVEVTGALGLDAFSELTDALLGPPVTVTAGGTIDLSIPPRSAVVLHLE